MKFWSLTVHPLLPVGYLIEVGEHKEEQRSSGIWVSTPAGSTRSLRSAGGTIMSLSERKFQFMVREACLGARSELATINGFLIEIKACVLSAMRTGEVYIDGPHIIHTLTLGDELVIGPPMTCEPLFIPALTMSF